MAKAKIKFNMPIDGVKVATVDQLRMHFTTKIIGHFRSGLLAKWLESRDLTRELAAVEALEEGDDAAVLKELCRIFEVEADDYAIAAAVVEATGVPGIRPERMPKPQTLNPGDTFQDCPECPKMVVVPSGTFMMGSSEDEEGRTQREDPRHEVTIGYQFAVGVYPVTFDEWDACVSDGGCCGYEPEDQGWGRGRLPVINVSWSHARTYTDWLSWKTGKGYRLLSESEWEYVARAGTATPYWCGDEIDPRKANCKSAFDMTTPVGDYTANTFGLYDVHGNVWEWVEDHSCLNYTNKTHSDGRPYLLLSGRSFLPENNRIIRGGCWESAPRDLRSANRNSYPIDTKDRCIGFRVARTLTP